MAGIEQQYQAALATHEHLITTQRALEARLAEAQRKKMELAAGSEDDTPCAAGEAPAFEPRNRTAADRSREEQIEQELDALRRELEG